ncbi:sorbicillinoid biosynthetic cluster transcription factor 2 [Colletotrichum spaethianum]|uniref:Solute carrier family 40 member n=1 Tax=Colletotrichum spaethianum TaxID=700344 RepID=A0AA37LH08_9PEZI|nr:sorbicillinoid biosynthetic cluster transcription factor 2 [Colletotrichum spaethianum]GKT46169.1 sorbicillinoid biosynthetic cluster transcription factor 2 [Colletotrichum spaethianum]
MSRPLSNEEVNRLNEQTALLGNPGDHDDGSTIVIHVAPRITRQLYLSHLLSTWNSRMFEFGAVLYLATIFPGTLLPMSLYALTRGLSGLVLAPMVGHYIDNNDRLKVARASIGLPLGEYGRPGLLGLLSVLACAEKLYSIINMVSIEKDWVVVLAKDSTEALATLNAQMRRIDLLCKLLAPLIIAFIDGISTEVAIIVNFAMNIASVLVEYYAIARIYNDEPDLQERKHKPYSELPQFDPNSDIGLRCADLESKMWHVFKRSVSDFEFYFNHCAFLPSFAGSLLYFTVLSFAGQMVTYLVASGYNTTYIGIVRTISVVFEVLATWVAPWLVGRIGPVRAGLWLSNCQVLPLISGLIVFWVFMPNPLISATSLVVGTIISRLGLRGFDLCTQIIVQEEVEAESRGRFSTIEAAWQNAFELLSYLSTILFFRPTQFKWPALISVIAVTSASLAYTMYVGRRRGHLIHFEKFGF